MPKGPLFRTDVLSSHYTIWKEVCKIIRSPKKLQEYIEALRTPDPTLQEEIPIEQQKKILKMKFPSMLIYYIRQKKKSRKKCSRLDCSLRRSVTGN